MLMLDRKTGQKILIGDDIEVVVSRIGKGRVSIGVKAPKHIQVDREEYRKEKCQNR